MYNFILIFSVRKILFQWLNIDHLIVSDYSVQKQRLLTIISYIKNIFKYFLKFRKKKKKIIKSVRNFQFPKSVHCLC